MNQEAPIAAETLIQRGTTLVRRLRLEPGETMPWHRDPFHRVTVVLRGDVLAIEYRDGGESERFAVTPGQVDWDEPTDRVHRGANVGEHPFADVGLLDEVIASIAPVTLGGGAPLLTRRIELRLDELGRNGDFVCAKFSVVHPPA